MSREDVLEPYVESSFSWISFEILPRISPDCLSSIREDAVSRYAWGSLNLDSILRMNFNCFLYLRQTLQISKWKDSAHRSAPLSCLSCECDINREA